MLQVPNLPAEISPLSIVRWDVADAEPVGQSSNHCATTPRSKCRIILDVLLGQSEGSKGCTDTQALLATDSDVSIIQRDLLNLICRYVSQFHCLFWPLTELPHEIPELPSWRSIRCRGRNACISVGYCSRADNFVTLFIVHTEASTCGCKGENHLRAKVSEARWPLEQ